MRLLTLRYKTYPNSLRGIAPGGKHHFTFISPSFCRRRHGLGRWPGSTGRQIGGGGVFTVFSERKAAAPREFRWNAQNAINSGRNHLARDLSHTKRAQYTATELRQVVRLATADEVAIDHDRLAHPDRPGVD